MSVRQVSAVAVPWKRAVSWAIDGAISVAAIALASAIADLLGVVVFVCAVPAYYVLLVGRQQGGTVGHRLLGLSVIDDRTGEPVDEIRASLRLVAGVAFMIPFLIPAAISVWAMFTRSDHKAWHDLASQTTVVSKIVEAAG